MKVPYNKAKNSTAYCITKLLQPTPEPTRWWMNSFDYTHGWIWLLCCLSICIHSWIWM